MKEEKTKLLQMVSSNLNRGNLTENSSEKYVSKNDSPDPPMKKLKVDENSVSNTCFLVKIIILHFITSLLLFQANFFKNTIKESSVKPSQEEMDAIETEIIDSHCDKPCDK